MPANYKKIICLDFDGVIHLYTSGWKKEDIISDDVVPGFFEWAVRAARKFDLQIYSSRSKYPHAVEAMKVWMKQQWEKEGMQGPMPEFKFCSEKPAAFLTIDDRAVQFNGRWTDITFDPNFLEHFQPWNKKGCV